MTDYKIPSDNDIREMSISDKHELADQLEDAALALVRAGGFQPSNSIVTDCAVAEGEVKTAFMWVRRGVHGGARGRG